jgi:hypothetical protein
MSLLFRTALSATLAAAAIALAPSVAGTAGASGAPASIYISPVGTGAAYFTVTIPDGGSRRLTVALSNPGTSVAQAEVYAANVYTIVNGGFAARLAGQPETGVTTWLDYPAHSLSIAPGRTQEQSFTVSVPANAPPGEHVTTLVVQQESQTRTTGAVNLAQVNRQALPIVIDVPGPLSPGLALRAVAPANFGGRTVVGVGVTNTGNLRLHPDATLVVTNSQGRRVGALAVKMGTVYPGDSTTAEGTLASALPPGHYTVTADLSDSHPGVVAQSDDFSIHVSAPPHYVAAPVPVAVGATPLPAQVTRGLPITLAVGLVLAALLAGIGATTGGAYLRRRRAGARTGAVDDRKGPK